MQNKTDQHPPDIILRSSERDLFYSWKMLLSVASPVFSDMFALPQHGPDASDDVNECHDGLPVVYLEEDSGTLDHILVLCHPPSYTMKRFQVHSIRRLRAVLAAITKYDMKNTRHVVLEELFKPSFLRKDPLEIYTLACQYECHEAAVSAAKYTLTLPSLVREYVPDLEKIHAGMLYRLLLYRESCRSAALSLALDHTWIVHTKLSPLFGCSVSESEENLEWTVVSNRPSRKYPGGREEYISVHKWWMEYMRRSEYALHRSPHGDVVKEEKLVEDTLTAISTSECKRCKTSHVSETFKSFVQTFAENVERRVAKVEIDLEF